MTKHHDLRLVTPEFDSKLMDLIIEFDFLQKKSLAGSTPPLLFFQLKMLFYTIESVFSARIEGNNTTIIDYIQQKSIEEKSQNLNVREIENIEESISYIHAINSKDITINRLLISELHQKVVSNLTSEGSKTPGVYRKQNISIGKSTHIPPDFTQISSYMDELFQFIAKPDDSKYNLLKVAIAHHRFTWIHPFDNGNGRVVRLLTYAMLLKLDCIGSDRIINPTAVFCIDRNEYYEALSKADVGDNAGMLFWCEYMLSGLKRELDKIDLLTDYEYLQKNILKNTINYSLERDYLSSREAKILRLFLKKPLIQSIDIQTLTGNKVPASVSRIIRLLLDHGLIIAEQPNSRKYSINLNSKHLTAGLIISLKQCGLLGSD